ncbi:alpha/beta fold hydrolase [Ramlibacter sp. AW1]|uniref:Alpha/beta fold hydrolase n=1 Tax=Ramlibacter aurantiacus TaxID=2801330 RepID=A0A937D6Z6_9BURK|nr:alpha/beta fold hydrolase [Ramlibacter aurantiacus]MBL0422812.1 alpha/beta fold hydrolase [Ramlibacter aurantiacus]
MGDPSRLHFIDGPACRLAVHQWGDPAAPAVVMNHSILASSRMWDDQARLLASRGYQVLCLDTRGHGQSDAAAPPYRTEDLAADTLRVLDAFGVERAHYVGLSLGGMTGFALGIEHGERLRSLCICDARADTPPAMTGMWDERITAAQAQGCASLARVTLERWFGPAFIARAPEVVRSLEQAIAQTQVDGFVGCARAIQQLDHLRRVGEIRVPTTFIVGADDGPLPQAMRDLQALVPGARLEVIEDAGHLPNVEQPAAFNAALVRHFEAL